MLEKLLVLYKNQGETPLACIKRFQESHPEYKEQKMGYAGRLDPMAEGLVLVLVGEENKTRDKYLKMDKVYETGVLFGVATDTYDALGKITSNGNSIVGGDSFTKALNKFYGLIFQKPPPYSAIHVNKKPLFVWARENKLSEIEIPERAVTVYSIELLEIQRKSAGDLKNEIFKRLESVKGDFRQHEIKKGWNDFFDNTTQKNFTLAKLKIHCSSGTYVRSIAHDLGKYLNTGAIALSIKRTNLGNFDLKRLNNQ